MILSKDSLKVLTQLHVLYKGNVGLEISSALGKVMQRIKDKPGSEYRFVTLEIKEDIQNLCTLLSKCVRQSSDQ